MLGEAWSQDPIIGSTWHLPDSKSHSTQTHIFRAEAELEECEERSGSFSQSRPGAQPLSEPHLTSRLA